MERKSSLMDSFSEAMERMKQEMNMLEGQMLDKDMDDDLDVEDRGFHTKVRRKEWKVIDDGKTVKYSG